ncbi:hypothetical protein M758_8G079400 [Ceratodon purpureus]|uniref:GPI-anchored protein LLG1-like domain-containing protein n=1 Tax=Ceratodon purpureus TaxID=3225 RepID=A0A8T0GWI2_CERPU|nr:hypothetical protein KC19_8G084700 [Ceratodon purpureus]KAG0608115.1 hypothetical protein M758_8G079400 [Ceratodon purpureus]
MANYVHMGVFVAFLVTLLSLPSSSVCARVMGATETVMPESVHSTIASPMAEYCATDFSQVSYEDVKAACPADSSQGANPACCAAFNNKACQYEAQVNNFGSMCPMLFINYLGAVGPYPAGYFVGPCVDGTKGFCIRK